MSQLNYQRQLYYQFISIIVHIITQLKFRLKKKVQQKSHFMAIYLS